MNNKNVLITGASKGIGKATKEIFEQNGYTVLSPSHEQMDLCNKDSVIHYCDSIKDIPLFAIINNAGINDINLLEDAKEENIDRMIQVDLKSPILLLNRLIPQVKKYASKTKEGGRVVNIGSIWAVVSKPGRSLYSAAKNGMHGITNALALELGESNILVNTVCPGFTLTELTKKNNSAEQIAKITENIPLRRMADPSEIAKLVYFLGSEENTYITGQKIVIDGGFTVQ